MPSYQSHSSLDASAIHPLDLIKWKEAFRVAWKIYLPLRLVLLAIGFICGLLMLPGAPSDFANSWFEQLFLAPWDQMDTTWYLKIARDGYAIADGRAAYHPLLPLLIGGLGRLLGGQYLLAAFIINDLACIATLAIFYRWLRLDYEPEIANHALRWLVYIPIGFVLFIPYTEALTLCWIILAFWFWRQERWLAAGLCGALASLTKQPAIALFPALAIDYIYYHRTNLWRWQTLKVALCITLIPLGYSAYSIYRTLISVNYDPNLSIFKLLVVSPDLNAVWGSRFAWPWDVGMNIIRGASKPDITAAYWIDLALVAVALVACFYVWRHIRMAEKAYIVIQIMLISTILLPNDPTMSMPRRFLLIFPIFLQFALWSTSNSLRVKYARLISGVMLLFLAISFITHKFIP